MAKARALSRADLELWALYSQTLSQLMPGRVRLPVDPPSAPDAPSAPSMPDTMPAPPAPKRAGPPAPLGLDLTPSGLDKATWKKFAGGKIRAERKLDLHGFTAMRAHEAVNQFIERSFGEQTRCVEIVTGKGEVLARELPHWLNAPMLRPMILAIAHPHAANTGAVRLLLRRRR